MDSKGKNIEILMGSKTDDIINDLFESFLERYQEKLEEKLKDNNFVSIYYILVFIKLD